METTILEAPDTTEVESNVEAPVETAPAVDSPEKESEQVEQTNDAPAPEESQEPTVELDGEQVPLSELKKMRADFKNDSNWKDKNRRESEELNKKQQRYARLELLEPYLEQHPEIIQQIVQPKPQRDIDRELQEHYNNIPNPDIDPDGARAWALKRDQMILEGSAMKAESQIQSRYQKESVDKQNGEVVSYAQDTYTDKVGREGLEQIASWVVANMQPKNGAYKKSDVDIAYQVLFRDKYLQELQVDTAKKVVAPLLKSKPNGGDGVKKQERQLTPQDADDDSFVQTVRQKLKK